MTRDEYGMNIGFSWGFMGHVYWFCVKMLVIMASDWER